MPTVYMLIGVPGAGKSTWIKNRGLDAVVVSTDDHIESLAATRGGTYDTLFKDLIGQATAKMKSDLSQAIADRKDVIWDQTNTTKKGRAGKLSKFPKDYRKVAVFFKTPADLEKRLASRPGKTIPKFVVANMINQLEAPSKDEGWDDIIAA